MGFSCQLGLNHKIPNLRRLSSRESHGPLKLNLKTNTNFWKTRLHKRIWQLILPFAWEVCHSLFSEVISLFFSPSVPQDSELIHQHQPTNNSRQINGHCYIIKRNQGSWISMSEIYFTSSLSKYWISSGFRNGRLPDGWSLTLFIVRSSVCMWNPVIPPRGVGVAVSFRAGVRMGT